LPSRIVRESIFDGTERNARRKVGADEARDDVDRRALGREDR
jgi:hypothetical protein